MSLIYCMIGDLEVRCFSYQNFESKVLNLPVERPNNYEAHFRDMPTGATVEISFDNEMQMVQFFSDWLICDDNEAAHARVLAHMPNDETRKKFMP